MTVLYDLLIDPLLNHGYFQRALVAGSLVAVVCGAIGCFIILRRMAFLGDAVAHAMLAGSVAGYLLMKLAFGLEANVPAMVAGSLLAGFLTVALINSVTGLSRIKEDTAIGIVYTGIFALGGVLASRFADFIHIDLLHFLMGQVLAVGDAELWLVAVVAALVLGVIVIFFRPLQLASFDPIMAASIGIPVIAMNYLLTTCTSLVVISGVQIVGMVMVIGLLVAPAATAYLLCDRLSRMIVLSSGFGVTSVIGGMYLAEWMNVAAGSSIVLVAALQFAVVLVVAPRYGVVADWLRRQSIVPQSIVEDVLGCLRRTKSGSALFVEVLAGVPGRPALVRRAIRSLTRRDLLTLSGDLLTLTGAGRREARRLMRAHRLWEAYLQHVGAPSDQLHERAHQLEHVHDEAAVDYIDDKLGHPLRDPHGSEIPEDFIDLVPGHEVRASLLREGHRATVLEVGAAAAATALEPGSEITAGPRHDSGRAWTFTLADNRNVTLDHRAADAVKVRLEAVTANGTKDS